MRTATRCLEGMQGGISLMPGTYIRQMPYCPPWCYRVLNSGSRQIVLQKLRPEGQGALVKVLVKVK